MKQDAFLPGQAKALLLMLLRALDSAQFTSFRCHVGDLQPKCLQLRSTSRSKTSLPKIYSTENLSQTFSHTGVDFLVNTSQVIKQHHLLSVYCTCTLFIVN